MQLSKATRYQFSKHGTLHLTDDWSLPEFRPLCRLCVQRLRMLVLEALRKCKCAVWSRWELLLCRVNKNLLKPRIVSTRRPSPYIYVYAYTHILLVKATVSDQFGFLTSTSSARPRSFYKPPEKLKLCKSATFPSSKPFPLFHCTFPRRTSRWSHWNSAQGSSKYDTCVWVGAPHLMPLLRLQQRLLLLVMFILEWFLLPYAWGRLCCWLFSLRNKLATTTEGTAYALHMHACVWRGSDHRWGNSSCLHTGYLHINIISFYSICYCFTESNKTLNKHRHT